MHRIACISLLALLLGGCFVIEELDSGLELMKEHSPKKAAKPAARAEEPSEPAAPRRHARSEPGALERVQQWWEDVNTPPPPPPDPRNAPVRCIVDGGLQLTQRDDCLLRGGRIHEPSP